MFMQELSFPQTAPTDDAFFQPELGWSVWGSLGWTKSAGGLDWRMPDRLAVEDHCSIDLWTLIEVLPYENKEEGGSARASPVAAPMPKSVPF